MTHAACDDTVWTWKEYYNDTIKAAKSFMHLGLGRFESVSILGFNSPEWLLSNMGAIAAGGFAAGIYTTNEPDACKYILKHSKARIVVVDGQKQLDKILKIRGDLKDLTANRRLGRQGFAQRQRRRRRRPGQGVRLGRFHRPRCLRLRRRGRGAHG